MVKEIPNPSNRSPAILPDLASSDFYMFGRRKGALAGYEFDSTREFLLTIREVTGSIGTTELESVSECMQMKDESIHQLNRKFSVKLNVLISRLRC
jgi:hypothetical protein